MISRVNLEGSIVLGHAEGGAVHDQRAVDQPKNSYLWLRCLAPIVMTGVFIDAALFVLLHLGERGDTQFGGEGGTARLVTAIFCLRPCRLGDCRYQCGRHSCRTSNRYPADRSQRPCRQDPTTTLLPPATSRMIPCWIAVPVFQNRHATPPV